ELTSRGEVGGGGGDAGKDGFGLVGDRSDDCGFALRVRRRNRREKDEQGSHETGANGFHRFLLDPGGFAPAAPHAVARGGPLPRSASAGAPVASQVPATS